MVRYLSMYNQGHNFKTNISWQFKPKYNYIFYYLTIILCYIQQVGTKKIIIIIYLLNKFNIVALLIGLFSID